MNGSTEAKMWLRLISGGGEAAGAFRRLRQTLSVTLGAKPSAESLKLFQELRLQ
jgi:hypothetical protein